MRFASLGSGSRGNGTLLESDTTCVLVDCGFSVRETERRLQRLGRSAEDLSALLVTHEHTDHIRGVLPLARKYGIPVYATHGTAQYDTLLSLPDYREINTHAVFQVGDIEVTPVAVPHDAREPCQYVFASGQRRLGLLTDLGSVTPYVCEQYRHCDALVLEFNHDTELLARGAYPPMLKRRVGGDWGHLSNAQAAQLLTGIERERLQHIVMAHISEQNNTAELAQTALRQVMVSMDTAVSADQENGFDWLAIA